MLSTGQCGVSDAPIAKVYRVDFVNRMAVIVDDAKLHPNYVIYVDRSTGQEVWEPYFSSLFRWVTTETQVVDLLTKVENGQIKLPSPLPRL